jgi:hydroxymethylbilane synthase
MLLAAAGVRRLGMERTIGEYLALDVMLPAVGQGALAIEIREDDEETRAAVSLLNHIETLQSTDAERSLLRELEGGCQVPIGAHAFVEGNAGVLRLQAFVGSLDGSRVVRGGHEGDPSTAGEIGRELAAKLLNNGAESILQEIRSSGVAEKG